MMNGGQEFQSTFSQDDRFFSRLASRDNKRYNSSKQVGSDASFRVLYYGGAAGSVPFLWESQPGTPKHKLSDGPLQPLTPPPQYQSSPLANPSSKKKHYSKIFNSIFATTPSKKISAPTTPPSSYSSTIRFELDVGRDSPTSTLCFRARRSKGYYGYPMKSVKKVVKSIAGRRQF